MPIEIDVRPVDDDDDLTDNYSVLTDLGFYVPADLNDLDIYVKHLNAAERDGASGTGLFSPFLRLNGGTTLQGFNTSVEIKSGDQNANNLDIDFSGDNTYGGDGQTVPIKLGDIPIVWLDLNEDGTPEAYYQINLDINENNANEVSLEELQIYTSSTIPDLSDYQLGGTTDAANKGDAFLGSEGFIKRFDLDANGDAELTLRDDSTGQGGNDYFFFIPVSVFDGANSTDFVTLYSQFGPTPTDDGGFAEWNTLRAAHIIGTKFNDKDSNGLRDVDGQDNILGNADDEAPLQGFTVYIDQNGNNKLDAGEQYAITDANGAFRFDSLLPNTSYTIREVLTLEDTTLVGGIFTSGSNIGASALPPAGIWMQTTGVSDVANGGSAGVRDLVVNVGAPGDYIALVGNHILTPQLYIDKTATVPGNTANAAGELISYTVAVSGDDFGGPLPASEVPLTNVVVTDVYEGGAPVILRAADGTLAAGVTEVKTGGDQDNILEAGEVWTYTYTRAVTQAEIDTNGGNGLLSNTATADSAETAPVNDSASVPVQQTPSIAITKVFDGWSGGDGDVLGDFAGDIATYTIIVKNTGNVTLTDVEVTDPLTGNTYTVGTLAPGAESDPITEMYTLSQADLDSNGTVEADNFKSGSIENTATATSDQTGEASASAVAPLVYNPLMSIDKVFVNVTGGDGDALADAVGDVLNYTVAVKNTGNVTLTNVTVTDPLTGGTLATGVTLAVGETNTYDASYTLTQDDLDKAGNAGTDGDIDNTATATSNEAPTVEDSVEVPLVYNPSFTVEKAVSFDDGQTWDMADMEDGPEASIMQSPTFRITIFNNGNITLSNYVITDKNFTFDEVNGTPIDLSGVTIVESIDTDGELDVGETWTLIYDQTLDVGYHKNTVTVEFDEAGPISDDAYYYVLVNDGPGVRTPGFWQNPNNGGTFWDGKADNQAHHGDTFPDGDPMTPGNQDLLYLVDTDGDGSKADEVALATAANANPKAAGFGTNFGLLIGDYDKDGIANLGEDGIAGTNDAGEEDVIFISYKDAQSLINASSKQGNDVTYTLGRDVVATWLNYLGGNNIDPVPGSDPNESPRHYLDDAIDWLQGFASTGKDADLDFTAFKFISYKSNSSAWKDGVPGDGDSHSGSDLHNALGGYNENGRIGDVEYAGDADSDAFAFALNSVITSNLYSSALEQEDVSQMMYANTLVSV